MWWFFSCTYPFSGFEFPLDRLQSPWRHHKALSKLVLSSFPAGPFPLHIPWYMYLNVPSSVGPRSLSTGAFPAAMPLQPSLLDESWDSIQWSLPLWRSPESPTPNAMSVFSSPVLMMFCTQTCYSFYESVMWLLIWMPLSLLTHRFSRKWSHSPLCPRIGPGA